MKKVNIGGEALIEGIMMRGPEYMAIAIRKANGEIIIEKKPYVAFSKRSKILQLPVIRGIINFFESMIVGMKALTHSADFVEIEDEEAEESKFDKFLMKVFGDKLQDVLIFISVAIALVFGVGLFVFLPNWLADLFLKGLGSVTYNIIEGVLRVALFVGYIALIAKMKDIQRVFMYHGAEHKSIACYEHEEELTVENIRKHTRFHPRCGTSFMFLVIILSIVVFSLMGWTDDLLIRIGSRILLLPLIAGLSYELIKIAGRSDSPIFKAISAPGLWLQRLTTIEPDDGQIEIAIAALKEVIPENKELEKW